MPASPFDAAYEGTPPWDIGRPQDAFVRLQEQGAFVGRVLDVGCGTGDLARYLCQQGHEVWGIDASPRALRLAAARARASGQLAQLQDGLPSQGAPSSADPALRLVLADALDLKKLRATFDTVADCGFFHSLSDAGRAKYLRSLEAVISPGGSLHLLCFSDAEPGWGGPRRIKRHELSSCFSGGWVINRLEPSSFENLVVEGGSRAWLMSATWLGKMAPGIN